MWSLGKVIDTPEVSRVYVGALLAIHVFLMPFFLELRVQAFLQRASFVVVLVRI